jgi:hypothetical protein
VILFGKNSGNLGEIEHGSEYEKWNKGWMSTEQFLNLINYKSNDPVPTGLKINDIYTLLQIKA